MNKENIPVITDREELYDKCENIEQLFDNYYLPLLYKHYSKVYELQQENKILKENYERIYNENCILREKHNINDIDLLNENTKLKEVVNKINLIIKGISYGGNEDYYMGKMKEINVLLKEVSE